MNLGIAILGIVLIVSIAAVLLFLVLPLALSPETRSGRSLRVLYFIAIGLGYIMVEIAFIQRFVLFLGYPTYALTVVIFLMLLSSGAGSLVSRKLVQRADAGCSRAGVHCDCVGDLRFRSATSAGSDDRPGLRSEAGDERAASGAAGICDGNAISQRTARDLFRKPSTAKHGAVEWAWAMNAASSVLGSVLAIVIAIQFGLTVTLACGAVAYVVAMLLLPTFGKAAAVATSD